MNKFRELDSTRCVAGSLGVCLAIWCACALAACSSSGKIVSWQEEVKLSDGRTIVIKHQERCDKGYSGKRLEHCIAREHWVTLDLPEFAAIPIVWHQSLSPIVVNIDAGKLYVVGLPPTGREDEMLGRPRPPYIGFVWQGAQWKQVAFEQIPIAIYDTNVYEGNAFTENEVLTVVRKESTENEMRGDPMVPRFLKRIDPAMK